jgi:rRNA maturation RNase YbeY
MPISIQGHDRCFLWTDEQIITHWLTKVASAENVTLKLLSIVYCSDEFLLAINRQYLSHDYYTDIITFDLSDGSEIEGELYLSLDRILENSHMLNVSMEEELCRVMVHGLLHLCGYSDQSVEDQKKMRAKESEYLSLLPNVPRGTFEVNNN